MNKIILTLLSLATLSACAQEYSEAIYSPNGFAIDGYDAVAYFTDSKAIKGNKGFSYQWKDATWLFATSLNRDTFKSNPEKYTPQYGGYCAWGMSKGYKAKVAPEKAWTISDGKLYLNYDADIKSRWLPKKEGLIKKADENWRNLQGN